MSLSEEAAKAASEKLAILHRADAFTYLITLPGWKEVYALHLSWADKYRTVAAKVNTADASVALEALRQWQLAEEFLQLEVDFINKTLQQAEELRGSITLPDAILMETFKNEQSEPTGDSGGGSNRAGY